MNQYPPNQPYGPGNHYPQQGGYPPQSPYPPQAPYPPYYNQPAYDRPRTNGMGVAGFVIALVTLFSFWIPVLNWVMWVLGFIFSFVGLFKQPRGLAVAGFVISLVNLLVITIFSAFIVALFAV